MPVALALVLLPALGSFGLWDPEEPRHAWSARSSEAAGAAEAPLVRWGIGAGTAILGNNALGIRLVGALLSLGACLAAFYAVGRLRGRTAGAIAALVAGSSPLFYFVARQAIPECYLAATAGTSLLFFCLVLFDGEPKRRLPHLAVASLTLALAVLARGPLPAIGAVLLPIALFAAVTARWSLATALRFGAAVAVVLLAVAAPWYATALAGGAEAGELLLAVQPAAETGSQRSGFDYYARGLVFGFLPWSSLFPVALVLIVGAWSRDALTEVELESCLLFSGIAGLVLINTVEDRFPQALALVSLPLGVLAGLTLDRLRTHPHVVGARIGWTVAAMGFIPILLDLRRERGLRFLIGSFTGEREVPVELDPGPGFWFPLGAVGLLLLLAIATRARILAPLMVAAGVLLAVNNASRLVPSLSEEKSVERYAEIWRESGDPTLPLGLMGRARPGVAYYSDGHWVRLETRDAFLEHMAPGRGAFSMVEEDQMRELRARYVDRYPKASLRIAAGEENSYVLVGTDP